MSVIDKHGFTPEYWTHFRDPAPPRKLEDNLRGWTGRPVNPNSYRIQCLRRTRDCAECELTMRPNCKSHLCRACRRRHNRSPRNVAPRGVDRDKRDRKAGR